MRIKIFNPEVSLKENARQRRESDNKKRIFFMKFQKLFQTKDTYYIEKDLTDFPYTLKQLQRTSRNLLGLIFKNLI